MSASIFSVFLFICNVKNKVFNSEKIIFTFGFTPKKAFIELKLIFITKMYITNGVGKFD